MPMPSLARRFQGNSGPGSSLRSGAMSLWPMMLRGLMAWRLLMSLSRTISDWTWASL
jgi:hypothetical protein